jgi:hypothetical protein
VLQSRNRAPPNPYFELAARAWMLKSWLSASLQAIEVIAIVIEELEEAADDER